MMHYKLLGRSGVRVSELSLGTMTFGEDWGWGASKEESRRIFDAYVGAGGNFIDTSVNYTDGTAEKFVGEFVHDRRDHFVIATKYTLSADKDDLNFGGNHRKNMMRSVNQSLRQLNTDYIDLLYLHMWDFTTPIEEIMRALDDLVSSGKVNYIGISDSPSWAIGYANGLADVRGWSRFVAVQVPYSLASRDPEREIIPMARSLDLAFLPWGILGGGTLTGKYNKPGEEKRYDEAGPKSRAMAEEIVKIAGEIGRSPSQIAINWVRHHQRQTNTIPILGARKLAQIQDNLACLDFDLTDEQYQKLTALSDFKVGFPMDFLRGEEVLGLVFGNNVDLLDNHRSIF